MVSNKEKIRVLDELIRKYPEKKFLRGIRKSYEAKSDKGVGEIDMGKEKGHVSNIATNIDDKEVLARLKPGECLEAEMRDDDGDLMFKAKVCKTKIDD
jgi:hypothetical protein